MNEITYEIQKLYRGLDDRGKTTVTKDEMSLIISFVNGLDSATLSLFESGTNQEIIEEYQHLVAHRLGQRQGDGGDNNDEEQGIAMQPLGGGRDIVSQNPAFFGRFHSNTGVVNFGGRTRERSLVSNVYNKTSAAVYTSLAAGITAVGSFAMGTVGGILATESAKASAEQYEVFKGARLALFGAAGTMLAAAGGYFIVRNHLVATQTADNDRLIDAVKKTAKVKLKLDKYVNEVKAKIIKGTADTDKMNDSIGMMHASTYGSGHDEEIVRAKNFIEYFPEMRGVKADIIMNDTNNDMLAFNFNNGRENRETMTESVFDKFHTLTSVL